MSVTIAPPVPKAESRLLRVARWTALAVIALATMEFGARLDDHLQYGAPLTGSYEFDRLFYFDGKIVRGQPSARYLKWSMNSMGLRGPDPDLSRPHTRVVVYGASEVFGLYETPGQDFPRQLEAELRKRGPNRTVEVINAGIPGMRIGSGAEYLRKLGEELKPSIVVLYPTPTHYTGVTKPHCGRPERKPDTQTESSLPTSRLLVKTVDRLKEVLPLPVLNQARQASIAWKTRGTPTVTKVDEANLSALDSDLRCAIRAVESIGARPVVLTHANRFGSKSMADDAYWLTGWRNQYPEYGELMLLDLERRANEVVVRVASEERIDLVDAAGILGGHREFFADHAHFNDAGAAHLGSAVAQVLAPMLEKK